jgi:hypothetical protein
MILANLRVKVKKVTEVTIELETDQGQLISMPKDLLPNSQPGSVLFLAADGKPLVGSEQNAKDVLNEVIKE